MSKTNPYRLDGGERMRFRQKARDQSLECKQMSRAGLKRQAAKPRTAACQTWLFGVGFEGSPVLTHTHTHLMGNVSHTKAGRKVEESFKIFPGYLLQTSGDVLLFPSGNQSHLSNNYDYVFVVVLQYIYIYILVVVTILCYFIFILQKKGTRLKFRW